MTASDDTVAFWIRRIGGEYAGERWDSVMSSAPIRRQDRSIEAGTYLAAARALLHNCRGVIARCGPKNILDEAGLKGNYYDLYYKFAERRKAGICVVRLFPDDLDRDTRERHDPDNGAVGLAVELSSGPADLGYVLFRHADLYSAMVHWTEENVFHWLVTSDPLLTLLLRDEWGALLHTAAWNGNQPLRDRVYGFAESFGIHLT
ncbi:MAG: hypothetical protein NXI31_13365 [bacterium]|nr:hypothetical protein [bacterium]